MAAGRKVSRSLDAVAGKYWYRYILFFFWGALRLEMLLVGGIRIEDVVSWTQLDEKYCWKYCRMHFIHFIHFTHKEDRKAPQAKKGKRKR